MTGGLRLMVYDKTCGLRGGFPGLSFIWNVGAGLYRALGRLDAAFGAANWEEALEWLASFDEGTPIAEIQYWGHGNWGNILIDRQPLDIECFSPTHARHALLTRVRDRLIGRDALIWLRTCETFGRAEGQAFARRMADFFQCRVAGHTYVIAWAQSGLHTLTPGQTPDWPLDEGLPTTKGEVRRARWSGFTKPNTVSFLAGRIPKGF